MALKPGEHHSHGCTVCGSRYSDACKDVHTNGRCQACRTSSARPKWDRDFDPIACCRTDARPVTKDEVQTYRLGGSTDWFRCRTCARTHPYSPSSRGRTA